MTRRERHLYNTGFWDGIKEARKIFRDTRKGTHMIVNKDDFEYLLDEVDRKLTLKHSEVRVVE